MPPTPIFLVGLFVCWWWQIPHRKRLPEFRTCAILSQFLQRQITRRISIFNAGFIRTVDEGRSSLKNIYTIVVMSSTEDSVRQFSIGHWSLRFLSFFGTLIFLGAVGGIGYGIYSRTKVESLHEDNDARTTQIELQRNQIEYLGKQLNQEMLEIRQMANMVRYWLGIDEEKGVLGQGGDIFDAEGLDESEPIDATFESRPDFVAFHATATEESVAEQINQLEAEFTPLYEGLKKDVEKYMQFPSILPLRIPQDGETQTFWFSSGFGYRTHPLTRKRNFHNGLDISARGGTPVIAPADGVVKAIKNDVYLGKMIILEHKATGTETLYGHLQRTVEGLRQGQKVARGDEIGYVGDTGRTTGTHLHYAVRTKDGWKNPRHFIIDY